VVALDRTTIAALRAHQGRQQAERAAAGTGWAETGYVFTTRTGKPVGPDRLTRLSRRLVSESGLPPVTLHGLRHGAATLALAAGTDLKIVQDQLGHSTITLTADTYTKRPARGRPPRCPGHRRHDHRGGPQRPRIQARRDGRDPHPDRGHSLRLLPDVNSQLNSLRGKDHRSAARARGRQPWAHA
jgi:hypothetical protein